MEGDVLESDKYDEQCRGSGRNRCGAQGKHQEESALGLPDSGIVARKASERRQGCKR